MTNAYGHMQYIVCCICNTLCAPPTMHLGMKYKRNGIPQDAIEKRSPQGRITHRLHTIPAGACGVDVGVQVGGPLT